MIVYIHLDQVHFFTVAQLGRQSFAVRIQITQDNRRNLLLFYQVSGNALTHSAGST
jgi:hypothetical protein